jgi:hypothetical protein
LAEDKNVITENVNFVLSHFVGQEFLYPRSIMTWKTKGQVFIDNYEQMYSYFIDAEFVDCRINGYPLHYEGERKKLYPSFIFIDLDLSLCSTCKYPIRKLDYILKQTLEKIKEEINGHPTVLWTGGGYHIYQPIKIITKQGEKQPLETFKELEEFIPFTRNDLTTEFMRFAEKYLTEGKGDPKHNPSINSCLIRIPEAINSKYNEKVKIIQKWDGTEAIANSLVLPFLDHLIQLKIENEELQKRKQNSDSIRNSNKIAWIDKLLETPIADHRYFCLWHILIPYLVNIKGLSEHEVISILTKWLDKCNKVNRVRWKYPQRIKEQLRYDKGYPPISLENLKKENFELYQLLQR